MRNVGLAVTLAVTLSGCLAHCVVAKSNLKTADCGETLAFVTCKNVCYSLFGCLPLCSGEPWSGGKLADWDRERNWWDDRATLDNNLLMVRCAAAEVGSSRIGEFRTEIEDSSFWSLFLIDRRELTTTATILKSAE